MKDEILRLTTYANDLQNRLDSPLPAKHVKRPESYKLFLTRELAAITKKLEALKLEGVTKK